MKKEKATSSIRIKPSIRKKLKLIAYKKEMTMNDVIEIYLVGNKDYIKKIINN
jgi:hypothetical protein